MRPSAKKTTKKTSQRATSKWWRRYDELERGVKATCKLCGFFASRGGGTTNLKTHLRSKHFHEFYALDILDSNAVADSDSDVDEGEGDADDVSVSSGGDTEDAAAASVIASSSTSPSPSAS